MSAEIRGESRRICFGTRSSKGIRAYAALLSVTETCWLRKQYPLSFIVVTKNLL